MAEDAKDDAPPIIIIKKVKKGGHDAHHGGAWKVAYADFVTAMMAFFMMLWLLNVTTEEQRKGIADYFAPTSASRSQSGAGGILSGRSMDDWGARVSENSPASVVLALSPQPTSSKNEADEEADEAAPSSAAAEERGLNEPTEDDRLAEFEERRFEAAEAELKQAIQEMPDLQQMSENLIMEITPEGLRIQIVDQATRSMFRSGSAEMFEHTRRLMHKIAGIVQKLRNRVTISGHTDSTPTHKPNGYGNWELSSDRANAARRELVAGGMADSRIAWVSGKADQEPLFSEDRTLPNNRRISILLLRESPVLPRDYK